MCFWFNWGIFFNGKQREENRESRAGEFSEIYITSFPARRCPGIRAPRWTSALLASGRLRSAFSLREYRSLKPEMNSRKDCCSICIALAALPGHLRFARLVRVLQSGPPLDLRFWSFLTFLHNGKEDVGRHLLWKFYKKIQRKSSSNVPPNLLACIRFLYKVVHKNGCLRKFNRSREIEFNFFTAGTIFMKPGTLVHHVCGYKCCLRFFNFCLGT